MKLGTSLCFAVSLFLTHGPVSSAQSQSERSPYRSQPTPTDDSSQAQNQVGQNSPQERSGNPQQNGREGNANSPGQEPSNQGQRQGKLQIPPEQVELVWAEALSQNQPSVYGQSWLSALNQSSGMSLASADDALRDHLKLPNGQGLVVTALDGNSPAAHAGIQLNDVLLRLGETPLGKPEDLDESLRKAGENPVSLALIRGGSQRVIQVQPQIRVTLGPAQPKAARHQYWIGVSVSAIGPALRSQLEIPTNSGLIVNEVVNDSPAAKAGVKVHDILLELDGKPLSDPGKLAEAVQLHGEKPIVAKFIRAGQNKSSSVLLTPAQRKTEAVASRDRPVQKYYFVRPGAVQYETMPYQAQPANSAIFYDWTTNSVSNQANSKNQKPAEDANAAVSKRLDALDAEIKQLRKAVEAIGKAEKTIEELNKAAAALNKAIKDSK